jgi:hypothetical protein
VRRTVRGLFADVGEVQEREVVVPVVAVNGVVARAVRALEVSLPALARGIDQVTEVRRADRVARVDLQRIGERDAERAAARDREVVRVARMLLGEQVRQQGAMRQQAVEVRGAARLPTIAP